MSPILLAYSNRADAAVLTAGNWATSTFPLANLSDPRIAKTARSTNALAASTLFAVDLGVAYSLRAIALVGHNLTTAATVRWRAGNAGPIPANAASHDVTANALQLTFQGDVPIDWGKQYAAMDVFNAITARYLYIEITDTANPAGYVEIGRLFVGGGFQPVRGASYGLKSGRDPLDMLTAAPTGTEYGTARRRRRTEQFVLNWLVQAEADRIHEMEAEVGLLGEVLYVPDPSDPAYSQRYGGLGTLRSLGAMDYPYPLTRSVPFEWKEKL